LIFVVNNDFTSSVLRGNHIAEAMGAEVLFQDIGGARNQSVVIVKETYRGLVMDAKDRGCRIVLDIIDFYCYKQRQCEFADLVDVLIVPNRACIAWYAERFPSARYAVIPHQWDYRIKGTAPQSRFVPGYIGKGFNCTLPQWDGPKVFLSEHHLAAAPTFNFHIALQRRDEKPVLLKPATKVSTAASVGANALTYRDPSAVELLGPNYPYYLDVDQDPIAAIRMARESFGGRDWKRGREKMKEVRERTSLQAIAALYRRLDEGDEAMLLDAPLREAA
jgi:hypothetical protein